MDLRLKFVLVLSLLKGVAASNNFGAKLCETQGGAFNCDLFRAFEQRMFIRSFEVSYIPYTLGNEISALDYSSSSLACTSLAASSCTILVTPSEDGQYDETSVPAAVADLLRHIMNNCHNQRNCTVYAPKWNEVNTVMNTGPCTGYNNVGYLMMNIALECAFRTTTTTTTTTSTTTPLPGGAQVSETNAAPTSQPTKASTEAVSVTAVTESMGESDGTTTKSTVLPVAPEGQGEDEDTNVPIKAESSKDGDNASSTPLANTFLVAFVCGLSLRIANNLN